MTKTIDHHHHLENNQDELIQTTTVFRRHSKGPVMFQGCSPSGDVIIIDNISRRKSYDLTGWYIERQTDSHSSLRYTFPSEFLLPPLTTIELWSNAMFHELDTQSASEGEQRIVRMAVTLSTWNRADDWSRNQLFDCDGLCRADFSHRTLTSMEKEEKNDDQ